MTDKLRQQVTQEAARLVSEGCDFTTARFRAARLIYREWVPEEELPSVQDIQQVLAPSCGPRVDRFTLISETVRLLGSLRTHRAIGVSPDGLEHTLQLFSAVYAEHPYDEELLTAALVLHSGLVIDRSDPLPALIRVLGESLTPRTIWFVETFPLAQTHVAGTIGQRARRRLESHPDFEQVLLLAELDRKVSLAPLQAAHDLIDLEEAVGILQTLDAAAGDDAW